MAKAAERLFLEHDRKRDAAHAAARRLADQIVVALHDVRSPNTFKSIDMMELQQTMQQLAAKQTEYIEEDRAANQTAGEALG